MKDKEYLLSLRSKMEEYSPISHESWVLIKSIVTFQTIEKRTVFLRNGDTAKNLHFICEGIVRAYINDKDGNIYNKNLLFKGDFCGSKTSLLESSPSKFTLETLEDTTLINFNFKEFRKIIDENEDVKNYYIAYLEKHWVIEKEKKELSLVMDNATERYLKLILAYPSINDMVSQLHIAAHLGITPTQLSRIRKKLQIANQHM